MKNHKFIYKGILNDKKIYLVICKKTGGEFYTSFWDKGLVQRSKCLCCNEVIK